MRRVFLATLLSSIEAYKFGIINSNSSFFEDVQVGWNEACQRLGVTCYYYSSGETINDRDPCARREDWLEELANLNVDGIAFKPCGASRTDPILTDFRKKHPAIPIVTFDSDTDDKSLRVANIGTDNVFLGRTLAKLLRQLRPGGGTWAFLGDKTPRINGFNQEITRYNDDEDRNEIWTEIERNFSLDGLDYLEQMEAYATLLPDAFVALVQSPMRIDNWTQFVDAHHDITYIGTDGSDFQLDYLSRGYVDGLVGQQPHEMGSKSLEALYDLVVNNKAPEADFLATNVVAYNLIPIELPPQNVEQHLLNKLKVVGFVCFAFVALQALFCLSWTFLNRKQTIVRAAQPFFLAMICVGVLIMSSSMIPLSFDDEGDPESLSDSESTAICMSVPWLTFTGFTVVFSALFSKTWRVNRLFKTENDFQRVRVTEKDVLAPFGVLLTLNLALLLCWTLVDPLMYVRVDNEGTDYWNRVLSSYGGCRSDSAVAFLTPLAVLNVGVVLIACYQAHMARDIRSEFSESRYIGLTVFSLFQALVTGIPVVTVVRDLPQAFYLVLTFTIFALSTAILMLIFLPKISLQKKYSEMSETEQQRELRGSLRKNSSKFGFEPPSSINAVGGPTGSDYHLPVVQETSRDSNNQDLLGLRKRTIERRRSH